MSYAYYLFTVSQTSDNIVNSDCFELTFTDSNAINITNGIPLTKKEAMQLTPYTFTIRNICNNAMDYDVNLETLSTSDMDLNAVDVRLDNMNPRILGSISNNDSSLIYNTGIASSSKTIFSGVLKGNTSRTFNLRIWIDQNATVNQAADKILRSRVVVYGTLHPNYSEAILASGVSFNAAIKNLAGDNNASIYTNNTSITSIERSLTAPETSDNAVNVKDASSDEDIYAWFNNGTVYLYTPAEKIYLNSQSNCLFYKMRNITSLDMSYFDSSRVTNMNNMFSELNNLASLDLSGFDTSYVTNMAAMFYEMHSLTSLDISSFNTSNVTNMGSMFYAISLTSLDVSHFDTSNVTDMSSMFAYMGSLTSLDLSNFDTSNVTSMYYMFRRLWALQSLDISNFDTSNVTNMGYMFWETNKLSSLDLSSFNTSKVENMQSMLQNLNNVTTIYVGSKWSTASVTASTSMFTGDSKLVGGAGTTYNGEYVDATYARVDGGVSNPGYFTLKTS